MTYPICFTAPIDSTTNSNCLSIVFYYDKLITTAEIQNPTITVITDRIDLYDQLFDTFAVSVQLVQAEFLVYQQVPIAHIESLNVYNQVAADHVKGLLAEKNITNIAVNVQPLYFF